MNQQFTVTQQNKGERLDKFLTTSLGVSRSQVQKMIKAGQIFVNEKTVPVHYFLKENDVVALKAAPAAQTPPTQSRATAPLEILYEDEDILVVNKPSGLIVHRAPGVKETTLVDALEKKYPQIKTVGDDPENRPGIVHRLDKEVSGCLVIAKTQKAFGHLKNQFQNHLTRKEYTALVYGKVSQDTAEIKFPLERAQTGRMAARPEGGAGKEAITRLDVIKRFPQYTLLKVQTLTGRTHQIRAHLKAYGHSIVGDRLYATRHQKIKEDLPQIFLHASKIGFSDLAREWRTVEAPLPKALDDFLKNLP